MVHRMLGDPVGRVISRAALVLGALALAGVAIDACGGTPSGSGVANIASSTTTTSTAASNSGPTSQGGSSQPGAPAGNSGGAHTQVGMAGVSVALSQCMRTHGMPNFPDPNSQGAVTLNGVNPQSAAFQKAQKACAKYEPNGGKPPSAAQQQAMIAQALKFSECMRSHGVAGFPDPKISGTGGHIGISISIRAGAGVDPNSPTFQKAQTACQSLMPGRAGTGTSTSSTKK